VRSRLSLHPLLRQLMGATRMANRRSMLLAVNDPRLAPYLTATDECARGLELERILSHEVQPRVRAVVSAYVRSDWPIEPDDVDDIVGQVTLRVLSKLRAATVLEEESVQNVDAYVTTLTKNSVRDVMRRRSPERTRIKSRLRYLFEHDRRLALWSVEGVTLCGLASWKNRQDHATNAGARLWSERELAAEGMIAALTALDRPVRLADLVSVLIPDEKSREVQPIDTAYEMQRDAFEARQYLQILWREIRELPPKQRAALLLNLREPGSGNAVTLFVAVGIATLDEIAEAVELSPDELSAIWDALPFDDLRIAAHLGLRRQQVINLRKSARERLARRMAVWT
jgi:DNA-directed RNA polymerase specialized sigma24 family protein